MPISLLVPIVLALGPQLGQPATAAPLWDFVETFDGPTAGPEGFTSPRWDVAVHSRDLATFHVLEQVAAGHGLDCAPPPMTHPVSAYADAVYRCKDHLMTALEAEGYGVIYLTPNELLDLSAGAARVRFDVSTLRTSRRDWIDIYVTAFDDNLQLPLSEEWPDLQGEPRNGVQIRMSDNGSGTTFRARVFRDWNVIDLPSQWWVSYEDWLVPDPRQRQTFELELSRTHVRFGMPEHGQWWVDEPLADLGWDLGLVQLGHHSYNPTKDPSGPVAGHDASLAGAVWPAANTWHWDDVRMSNTVPYVLTKATVRAVSSYDPDPTATLEHPAPAKGRLRFSAIGQVEVSFDGGAFEAANRNLGSLQAAGNHQPGQFSSYWMGIPEGTQRITFRFDPDGWWSGYEMLAKDIVVWSPGSGVGVGGERMGTRAEAGGEVSKP